MGISLAEEHAYYFVPQIPLELARDRIEKKKTTLVAGMIVPGGGIAVKLVKAVVDRGKK